MQKDIAMFVEGHGFGHAARMYKVAEELNAKIISFKDGAAFFKNKGFEVVEIKEPYPLAFNEKEFDLFKSFKETLKLFDVDTVKTLNSEIKDTSMVVVDSSLLGLIFAKAYNKKLVFVSNNTDVSVFFTGQKAKIVGESVAKLISYANKVVICDFPPPYSISLLNLKFLDNMEFIGPLTSVKDIRKGKKEFGLVSTGALDPDDINSILDSIEALQLDYVVLNRYRRQRNLKKVRDLREYYGRAKWMITHGGHSTIMEALQLGIPLIVIPQENYAERYNNALMVEKLGLGVKLHENYITSEVLEKAIEDSLILKGNVRRFSKWARKFDGSKRLIQIIQEMS